MQQKKTTIVFSLIISVFVFFAIILFYQFSVLNDLQNQLQEKNKELQCYEQLINETNEQIELVQTKEYIEKWAQGKLGWVSENQIKIEINNG